MKPTYYNNDIQLQNGNSKSNSLSKKKRKGIKVLNLILTKCHAHKIDSRTINQITYSSVKMNKGCKLIN